MTPSLARPGWYQVEPNDEWRFWNGSEWTQFRSSDGIAIAVPDADTATRSARAIQAAAVTLAVLAVVVAIVWFRDVAPALNESF